VRYVVIEGLPAAGKSEVVELLARFYPERVRAFPELVKQIVLERGLDLFADRAELSAAIAAAWPTRKAAIREAVAAGALCVEESHLGVHYAYSAVLGDASFTAEDTLDERDPRPDAVIRLDIPIALSVKRQCARGTHRFDVDGKTLTAMLDRLDRWHEDRGNTPIHIDADRPARVVIEEIERTLGLTYGVSPDVLDETFDVLLLLGRPASGKSEFIDFMQNLPAARRAERFRIAPFDVFDDFPILWEVFEEDDIWEALGRDRLHSKRCNGNYAVVDNGLWNFLIEKLNQQTAAVLRESEIVHHRTLIIEFSRGGASGYTEALSHLSPAILRRAAILYFDVSFDESWRRNIARYDEKRRSGLLTHSVPHEEMERTYGADDWARIAGDAQGTIEIRGVSIPYATMGNEPEFTDPIALGERYASALRPLYDAWRS